MYQTTSPCELQWMNLGISASKGVENTVRLRPIGWDALRERSGGAGQYLV
jgi:hypothetical protein